MSNLTQLTRIKHFTSRTAILTYKVCPYKRFIGFELDESGYSSEKSSLDLTIGIVVHRGIQHLLDHCRVHHPTGEGLKEECIDAAVKLAYDVWKETLSKHSLWLHAGEEERLDWIIAEQECLFEGLIRAFALKRLPSLLAEYEILEVEREEIYNSFSPLVVFLGKLDGLLLRRTDKRIIVLSLKTANQFAAVTTRDILHDMQGVSEQVIVQDRLQRWWEIIQRSGRIIDFTGETSDEYKLISLLQEMKTPPEVFGVQYEFLLKGQRRQDNYNDPYSPYMQKSFLCHPYSTDPVQQIFVGRMRDQGLPSVNPSQYKWSWGKGKQPKGWNKIDIWNDVGIKTWIEMLHTGQVQPELGHPFDVQIDDNGKISGGVLYTPDLIVRGQQEMEEWKVSTRHQEEIIVQNLEKLETYNEPEELQQAIWRYFPKNTLSCHDFYGKDCHLVKHCHEMDTVEALIDGGYLIRRKSHHEAEQKYLEEQGKSE